MITRRSFIRNLAAALGGIISSASNIPAFSRNISIGVLAPQWKNHRLGSLALSGTFKTNPAV